MVASGSDMLGTGLYLPGRGVECGCGAGSRPVHLARPPFRAVAVQDQSTEGRGLLGVRHGAAIVDRQVLDPEPDQRLPAVEPWPGAGEVVA
jgi:hypothetical protein